MSSTDHELTIGDPKRTYALVAAATVGLLVLGLMIPLLFGDRGAQLPDGGPGPAPIGDPGAPAPLGTTTPGAAVAPLSPSAAPSGAAGGSTASPAP